MASDEIKACFVFNTGVRSTLIDPERVEIFRNGVAWPRRGHPPINVVVTYALKAAPTEIKEMRGVVDMMRWEAGRLSVLRVTNDNFRCTFVCSGKDGFLYGSRDVGIYSEAIENTYLLGDVTISIA